ncbi:hypothetical protein QBC47DRAFT_389818 [Echria macrotheca]|uniref:Uncharacterized protein n=1 Tax=Echria macrotheca TaxID=438768 RepID=A0AAJ0B818_9PEZI|nr:hypothetical protein QBC47DRAFT_389818 [Echria macrotheca]
MAGWMSVLLFGPRLRLVFPLGLFRCDGGGCVSWPVTGAFHCDKIRRRAPNPGRRTSPATSVQPGVSCLPSSPQNQRTTTSKCIVRRVICRARRPNTARFAQTRCVASTVEMESSSLIKAHDHARAASRATHSADTTVAITEHALAAGEFANAAKAAGNTEALRTLRLLEEHHKRLSDLLKVPLDPPSQQSTADSDIPEEDEGETGVDQEDQAKKTRPSGTESPLAAATTASKPPPVLSQHRRYPGRELSSSIASNLASARGIKSRYRGQPVAPSVSNDQAPGSLESRPRRDGSVRHKPQDSHDDSRKPSWIPPTQDPIQEDEQVESSKANSTKATNTSEEGFSRFYSTFGNLINRLSAPLAFAGLPLVAEEQAPEAPPSPVPEPNPPKKTRQKSVTAGPDPELSKIFSRATIRALSRDGQGGDSFYVVPTSGHTASYASILNHENKEKRRNVALARRDDTELDDQDDDDFVDAKESQPTMLPGFRKRPGKSKSERDLHNTVEELHTENASLKEMLDKLSKRLHAFELNSQSTHLALAQSIRLQRPGSPMSSSGGPGDDLVKKRNRELEEQLASAVQRMALLEKDNAKQQQTLEKYRRTWEKLKAGAKARREAQEQSSDGDPVTPF